MIYDNIDYEITAIMMRIRSLVFYLISIFKHIHVFAETGRGLQRLPWC